MKNREKKKKRLCDRNYRYNRNHTDTPEKQWVNVLKAKKEKAIKEARARPDAEANRSRDLILDVTMIGTCNFFNF